MSTGFFAGLELGEEFILSFKDGEPKLKRISTGQVEDLFYMAAWVGNWLFVENNFCALFRFLSQACGGVAFSFERVHRGEEVISDDFDEYSQEHADDDVEGDLCVIIMVVEAS